MSANPASKATVQRLLAYIKPYRAGLLLSILAYMAAAGTEALIPKLLQLALDNGRKSDSFPIWYVPVALIGLYFVRGCASFAGQYLLNWSVLRGVRDLRNALASALLGADANVYTGLQAGTAVTKVVNDPQQSLSLLGSVATTVLRDGLPALVMLIYLFVLDWQLTLLSLVILPLMAFVVKKVNRRVRKMGHLSYDAQMQLSAKVDDLTRAWRVVRSFDAADYERGRFGDIAQQVQRNSLKQVAAGALGQPLSQMVASIGISLIVSIALLQARENNVSAGAFAAYIGALLLLASRLRHLSDLATPLSNALVIGRGCLQLLDLPAEPDQGQHRLSTPVHGELRLEEVRLQYPGAERPALNGLSLVIPAGRTTALVGSSGAGKSSVIHLLLGFGRPDGGRVLLDGVDIQELSKAELRRQFAVVSQDIVLFDASVADNVAYAQPRDPARLEQALRAAHLWDFVQGLPQGLETPVGANGSKLSGGQRQRLAIARALYKEAPIWVFDEATSALDTESERAVQQALEQWQGRKTLIVIAHRLSTVRSADAIHVLGDGRVLESGSHAELLAGDGAYANMVQAQIGD
jgi:ATP-binding cassette, subfamily B, bacterial MsbA